MNKIPTITITTTEKVDKGWGHELQIVNQLMSPVGYSGKLLVYYRKFNASSMHFHTVKDETFYVLAGLFCLAYYDPETADVRMANLKAGEVVHIPPHNPHQITCLSEGGTIVEFASADAEWDNFRISKGDSQRKILKFPLDKTDSNLNR